ncbi:UNVERIFIED_CONTAM: hypothetical protein HHA_313305 [Hammondia hammondi]|eukprot:XP_008883589.1 hypothetical protein HHA_313305 [Hammondia hammondi]
MRNLVISRKKNWTQIFSCLKCEDISVESNQRFPAILFLSKPEEKRQLPWRERRVSLIEDRLLFLVRLPENPQGGEDGCVERR